MKPASTLRFAEGAALTAHLGPDTGARPQMASLTAVSRGAPQSFSIPTGSVESTQNFILAFAAGLEEGVKDAKPIMKISKLASDLFIQQVMTASTRAEAKATQILAEITKSGKYTKDHVDRLLKVWKSLESELMALTPLSTWLGITPDEPPVSPVVNAQLAERAQVKLSGRPARNLTRNLVKDIVAAPKATADMAVRIDLKTAERLKKLTKVVVVLDFAAPASLVLFGRDSEERMTAVAALIAKLSVKGVSKASTAAAGIIGAQICIFIGLTPAGWVITLAGAVWGITTGFYVDPSIEKHLAKHLEKQISGVLKLSRPP